MNIFIPYFLFLFLDSPPDKLGQDPVYNDTCGIWEERCDYQYINGWYELIYLLNINNIKVLQMRGSIEYWNIKHWIILLMIENYGDMECVKREE